MKHLLLIVFLAAGSAVLAQPFGTLIVSDYDDPLTPVEGAAVYFDGRLLGTTDHVGSFRFPEQVRGTIKLARPGYSARELKIKAKKGRVIDADMSVTQPVYDSLKALHSGIIYAQCIAAEAQPVPVSGNANTQQAFDEYVTDVLRYPKRARDNGEEGTVQLRFRVEADGSVSCVEITKSVSYELDKEAFRILSNMPAWEPAKRGGLPVASIYSAEITFRLKT